MSPDDDGRGLFEPDGLYEWAAVQFRVSHLVDEGEMTEREAWWWRRGWIPATARRAADG